MPAFPERESSILAVLKKRKPGRVPENDIKENKSPTPITNHNNDVNNTSSGSADLLGLSTPPTSQPNSGNTGVLLDVLGDIYSKPTPVTDPSNNTWFVDSKKFVCKNNGVLFENDLIQIGVKSEFRQNLGRLGLFYGNKTSSACKILFLLYYGLMNKLLNLVSR
ncbi:hypothetical protein NQ318_006141 [Aromia moschata]|uniref:Clathrin adaptor alpha/beta/gamma-adaptin appendage Ig-like subdomain domain-containing protein n=1 Tax=Aromia moschata TaxID=1265417 RepID=A0AAV8XNN9_9CUCU|nr:hypothetical protein NQ318_006141 [Aromia moschata]